ncbi:MAG: hypothetical protein ACLGHI_06895 [Gammaproteobacteria bacterium]
MGLKLPSTNPYLRDPIERDRAVFRSVASSSAIEGIRAPFRQGKSVVVSARPSNGQPTPNKS